MTSLIAAAGLALSLPGLAPAQAPVQAPVPAPACPALDRPTDLTQGFDIVLVGEAHGAVEAPAVFGDLVCNLVGEGRPLVIGFEHPANSQAALDAWMASDGGPAAEAALLAAPAWLRPDGRSSVAMLDLARRVRALKAAGHDVAMVAFDHEIPQPGTSIEREAAMAALLAQARQRRPEALVIALTGSGHADRTAFTSTTPPAPSMIRNLPNEKVLSLAFMRLGGQAWSCRGLPQECSVQPLTARDAVAPRGVVLGVEREGFDGVISAGAPFTASSWARNPDAG